MRNITAILLLILCSCASKHEVIELDHKVAELDAKIIQLENTIDSLLLAKHYPKKKQSSESLSRASFYTSPKKESGSEQASSYKPRYESSNARCQATTKRGTQCKRFAQDGRSYCWQH